MHFQNVITIYSSCIIFASNLKLWYPNVLNTNCCNYQIIKLIKTSKWNERIKSQPSCHISMEEAFLIYLLIELIVAWVLKFFTLSFFFLPSWKMVYRLVMHLHRFYFTLPIENKYNFWIFVLSFLVALPCFCQIIDLVMSKNKIILLFFFSWIIGKVSTVNVMFPAHSFFRKIFLS